ncbi:MAG TPA: haloacid dehalogenase-like hydrolase, partial [Desertimonas sp.]|nr:haloacid dehalogenase-like hydrolase [Desertimonas sp.]
LPRLLDKIRPEARRLLDLHRHAGRATYIVSASPVEIVEPLAASTARAEAPAATVAVPVAVPFVVVSTHMGVLLVVHRDT